jgi:hypothetical protein
MSQQEYDTIQIEQYRCRRCNRRFYVNSGERSEFDLDFGCPYGCDDNGCLIGAVRFVVTDMKEVESK